MHKVEAIVRAHKLDDIKLALVNAGIIGMTVSELKGFGANKGSTIRYRGQESKIQFVSKIKIEVIIDDSQVDLVVQEISLAGRTGQIGDGKILVTPIDDIIRIRTEENGLAAI